MCERKQELTHGEIIRMFQSPLGTGYVRGRGSRILVSQALKKRFAPISNFILYFALKIFFDSLSGLATIGAPIMPFFSEFYCQGTKLHFALIYDIYLFWEKR